MSSISGASKLEVEDDAQTPLHRLHVGLPNLSLQDDYVVYYLAKIASRASYIAEFTFHDEFHPERTEDGRAVDGDDYGLLLHDPEGARRRWASTATRMLRRAPAPRRTRRPRGESRRCRDAALEMPETLCAKFVK